MKHRCLAEGCKRAVDARYLMCGVHWRMVPLAIQRRVHDAYVPGQSAGTVSTAWEQAADAAVAAVRAAEAKGGPSGG